MLRTGTAGQAGTPKTVKKSNNTYIGRVYGFSVPVCPCVPVLMDSQKYYNNFLEFWNFN
jgi:hypothetical protein